MKYLLGTCTWLWNFVGSNPEYVHPASMEELAEIIVKLAETMESEKEVMTVVFEETIRLEEGGWSEDASDFRVFYHAVALKEDKDLNECPALRQALRVCHDRAVKVGKVP